MHKFRTYRRGVSNGPSLASEDLTIRLGSSGSTLPCSGPPTSCPNRNSCPYSHGPCDWSRNVHQHCTSGAHFCQTQQHQITSQALPQLPVSTTGPADTVTVHAETCTPTDPAPVVNPAHQVKGPATVPEMCTSTVHPVHTSAQAQQRQTVQVPMHAETCTTTASLVPCTSAALTADAVQSQSSPPLLQQTTSSSSPPLHLPPPPPPNLGSGDEPGTAPLSRASHPELVSRSISTSSESSSTATTAAAQLPPPCLLHPAALDPSASPPGIELYVNLSP